MRAEGHLFDSFFEPQSVLSLHDPRITMHPSSPTSRNTGSSSPEVAVDSSGVANLAADLGLRTLVKAVLGWKAPAIERILKSKATEAVLISD